MNLTWYTSVPRFTECFQTTALAWAPCVFLWVVLPFYSYYLSKLTDPPTPVTKLNTAKTVRTTTGKLQFFQSERFVPLSGKFTVSLQIKKTAPDALSLFAGSGDRADLRGSARHRQDGVGGGARGRAAARPARHAHRAHPHTGQYARHVRSTCARDDCSKWTSKTTVRVSEPDRSPKTTRTVQSWGQSRFYLSTCQEN